MSCGLCSLPISLPGTCLCMCVCDAEMLHYILFLRSFQIPQTGLSYFFQYTNPIELSFAIASPPPTNLLIPVDPPPPQSFTQVRDFYKKGLTAESCESWQIRSSLTLTFTTSLEEEMSSFLTLTEPRK